MSSPRWIKGETPCLDSTSSVSRRKITLDCVETLRFLGMVCRSGESQSRAQAAGDRESFQRGPAGSRDESRKVGLAPFDPACRPAIAPDRFETVQLSLAESAADACLEVPCPVAGDGQVGVLSVLQADIQGSAGKGCDLLDPGQANYRAAMDSNKLLGIELLF